MHEEDNNDGTITISKNCSVTDVEYSVTVPVENYNRWKNGELIQRALPMLDVDQREFLISSRTPTESAEFWRMLDEEYEG